MELDRQKYPNLVFLMESSSMRKEAFFKGIGTTLGNYGKHLVGKFGVGEYGIGNTAKFIGNRLGANRVTSSKTGKLVFNGIRKGDNVTNTQKAADRLAHWGQNLSREGKSMGNPWRKQLQGWKDSGQLGKYYAGKIGMPTAAAGATIGVPVYNAMTGNADSITNLPATAYEKFFTYGTPMGWAMGLGGYGLNKIKQFGIDAAQQGAEQTVNGIADAADQRTMADNIKSFFSGGSMGDEIRSQGLTQVRQRFDAMRQQ